MSGATEPKNRLGVWLTSFIGAIVLGVALEAPPWIPEWDPYVDGLAVCLMLVSAVASVGLLKNAVRLLRRGISSNWRWLAYLGIGSVVLAVWAFATLLVALAIDAPLGPTYSKQFRFAEFDTTIYLYDSSFLDRQTTVYVRRGVWPWRKQVMRFFKTPSELDVVQRGNLLMIEDRSLDLRRGQ